jgi:hypothetical protein
MKLEYEKTRKRGKRSGKLRAKNRRRLAIRKKIGRAINAV